MANHKVDLTKDKIESLVQDWQAIIEEAAKDDQIADDEMTSEKMVQEAEKVGGNISQDKAHSILYKLYRANKASRRPVKINGKRGYAYRLLPPAK